MKTYHVYVYKHYEFEYETEEDARKASELKNPLHQSGLIAQAIKIETLNKYKKNGGSGKP